MPIDKRGQKAGTYTGEGRYSEAVNRRRSVRLTGRPKVCKLCHQAGHNRRGCPWLEHLGLSASGRKKTDLQVVPIAIEARISP